MSNSPPFFLKPLGWLSAPLDSAPEEWRAAVVRYAIEHTPPKAHLQLAILYAEAWEIDRAFEHLAGAIEGRDPCLVHLAVAPQWDSLRSDARFSACLMQMGLPQPSISIADHAQSDRGVSR